MFGSDILETAIGLVAVFALMSIVCSAARETLEALLKSRSRNLEVGIEQLVGREHAKEIYDHPMVSGLFKGEYVSPRSIRAWVRGTEDGGKMAAAGVAQRTADLGSRVLTRRRLPSYIPARNFAVALYDLSLQRVPEDATTTAERKIVPVALQTAYGGAEGAISELENWYNSAMDRVSGWYKRRTHWILLLFASLLTISMDVNTFTIADHLYRHRSVREGLIARIESGALASDTAQARVALESMGLPLGWPESVGLGSLLGWLVTILAVSLGAPFWFDVLNKLMVIRSTVKPHEKSPEEGSEDRWSRSASRTRGASGTSWEPLPLAHGAVPAAGADPGPPGEGSEAELQRAQ
jgi:hypothetical protein